MKIKKSFMAFVGMIGLLASLASCSDWGQMDPAAGTDVYPTREKLSTLNFNESTSLEELGYVQSYWQQRQRSFMMTSSTVRFCI